MQRILALLFLVLFFVACLGLAVYAHDPDHPDLDNWYSTLKQPDNPTMSCCGEADAYWCDDEHVIAGKNYCAITDDRDDKSVGSNHMARAHIPMGTLIEIPDKKIKFDQGNPTGHSIVFAYVPSPINGGYKNISVYCYVRGAGG